MAEITLTNPQGAGRPKLTAEEIVQKKANIVRKIEPYLRSGISLHKAIREAKIVKSELYQYMSSDEEFRDLIDTFRQFPSILLNNTIMAELQGISKKQNGYTDAEGKKIPPQKLNESDRQFLWKFALTSNSTKDEFGERKDVNLYDPEAEIQKVKSMIDENYSDEIIHPA